MGKSRVVADTNILVSGLLWIGAPHEIIKLAENKYIILFSSLPLIKEISEVLAREKFMRRIEELKTTTEELIESLFGIMEIVHPKAPLSVVKNDPDDNKVLECAVAADAEYVITGDPHLLKLKRFQSVSILTPRNFIQSF